MEPDVAIGTDFVWLSQGPAEPPLWIRFLQYEPNSSVLWGSFLQCPDDHEPEDSNFQRICSKGTNIVSGRNALYHHALRWERQRGSRFLYFIFADENGEFGFTDSCKPPSCGDVGSPPRADETAPSYFQRLLRDDQPAFASPVEDYTAPCISPNQMRVCTTQFDAKVNAYHWSAHPLLLPWDDSFLSVSAWAQDCIISEILEAAFVGYAVQYRMFRRVDKWSTYPRPRANYIRNLQPCLPQELGDGRYADSAVVAWLRPQLSFCASSRLGGRCSARRV